MFIWHFIDVDIVIEAVSENPVVKDIIFKQLDEITRPDTILASNTSSISITKIGAVTKRPDRVIGMHFVRNYISTIFPAEIHFIENLS